MCHDRITTSALIVAVVALCSCDGLFEHDGERSQVGAISFYSEPVTVEAPDTVAVNQPFAVLVRTYGNGCVSQGRTQLVLNGLQATVTPYDVHDGGDICPDILRMFDHEVTLTFEEAGVGVVTFRGRREPEDTMTTETRVVQVR
jgi:hypothetical protein